MPQPPSARGAALLSAGLILSWVGIPVNAFGAGPKDPDPVREGSAPVRTSEWWYDAMHIADAHKQTTGKGVKIALLEATLDPTVPELRGQDLRIGPGCAYTRSKVLPHSRDVAAAHGTSMAALLVGNGKGTDHGKGLRGVAPDAQVTFYGDDYWDLSGPEWADCFQGVGAEATLKNALADRPDIINLSLTFAFKEEWDKPLQQAFSSGAVVVAATRPVNDRVDYPWSYPGVVSVVAADRNAKPWAATNPSNANVITAPGVEVGTGFIDERGWRSNVWHDGTSQATAIVSGALALVKAKYPDSTGNQLIQHLIHYTGGTRGYAWSKQLGFGIVSVTKMLETSPTQWPDENPLLKGPSWAVQDYPMWASSLIDAPAGATDRWAKAENAAKSPAKSGNSASSESAKHSGGTPGWLWPVGGIAVVIVAIGAALGLRGRAKGGN
jgi:subtilisin family serine protease